MIVTITVIITITITITITSPFPYQASLTLLSIVSARAQASWAGELTGALPKDDKDNQQIVFIFQAHS